jgi:transposase InsO family protein
LRGSSVTHRGLDRLFVLHHRTDKQELYQLLTYKDDVDLEKKLVEWENFYNHHRPHGAFAGKTPYEALRERLR